MTPHELASAAALTYASLLVMGEYGQWLTWKGHGPEEGYWCAQWTPWEPLTDGRPYIARWRFTLADAVQAVVFDYGLTRGFQ